MESEDILKLLGGVIVALIAGAFTFFAGHRTGQAAFINAVSAAADKVIKRLESEIERVTGRCDHLEGKVADCEDHRRQCEAEVADLRRLITDRRKG